MARVNNILDLIGNTPSLRLGRMFGGPVEVWVKLERANVGGSIKDRIAVSMVLDAEERGLLAPGGVIVEPTSGNTGVALAMVAAARGYHAILVMPESMSLERRALMTAYGAHLELTPRELGMRGAIDRALELLSSTTGAWMPRQFENPANIEAHRLGTAAEIAVDFPEGLDFIFAGVGTGGHATAVGETLHKRWPALKVIAVEPAASPVLSGGKAGSHPIQGLGGGFVPDNFHAAAVDEVVTVEAADAYSFAVRAAREEGLLVGISSGATMAAAAARIPSMPAGSRVLVFAYDSGERYLSVTGLFGPPADARENPKIV